MYKLGLHCQQSGGLVTLKENNSEVEVVYGCFTGVSDSILQACTSGSLAAAL